MKQLPYLADVACTFLCSPSSEKSCVTLSLSPFIRWMKTWKWPRNGMPSGRACFISEKTLAKVCCCLFYSLEFYETLQYETNMKLTAFFGFFCLLPHPWIPHPICHPLKRWQCCSGWMWPSSKWYRKWCRRIYFNEHRYNNQWQGEDSFLNLEKAAVRTITICRGFCLLLLVYVLAFWFLI